MKRMVGVLLALLVLPLAAASQQVPTGPDGTHLVSSGETLGSIAERYYGAASEWPRIFEANRDRLADPDVLTPGLDLRIPGIGGASAAVVGVEIQGPPPSIQDVVTPETRRALLETSPFEPRSQPVVPRSDRTVFFEFDAEIAEAVDTDRTPVAEPVPPAVLDGTLRAAGWIVPTGTTTDELGVLTEVLNGASVSGAEVASALYGSVRIESRGGRVFQVGERYQTFSLGPPIEGLGRVAAPSAVIEVTETGGQLATARVVELLSRPRAGHLLRDLVPSTLQPGVYPSDSDLGVSGRLVALQRPAELSIPRLFTFADLGTEAGIQMGDEFVGVADGVPDWSSETVARFRVVGVRESTSTLFLVSTTDPKAVKPGLRVVLDRSMP